MTRRLEQVLFTCRLFDSATHIGEDALLRLFEQLCPAGDNAPAFADC
ncbi:hypothetical protein SAMN04489729_7943 [Amycolatopsis lurida]|nr:hypothetical protein [Amycolatopsis lurida]SEE53527.1 hypothetical protein SAMN04489729_7943 [Amycolatopsis lurida]